MNDLVVTKKKLLEILPLFNQLRLSGYEITEKCNFSCKGCHFFEGPHAESRKGSASEEKWAEVLGAEKIRGVNFPQIAGAEPSLAPEILHCFSQHFNKGLIYTNGTVPIDYSIDYRIMISVWGGRSSDSTFRGDGSKHAFERIAKNYNQDKRALILYTINSGNIQDIEEVCEFASQIGVKVTFNAYSPLSGDSDNTLCMNPGQLQGALLEIKRVYDRYPHAVLYDKSYYSLMFGETIARSINESGEDESCPLYYAPHFKEFDIKAEPKCNIKCCTPSLSCKECRIGTGLMPYRLSQLKTALKGNSVDLLDYVNFLKFFAEYYYLSEITDAINSSMGSLGLNMFKLDSPPAKAWKR